jgi:deoxyribodipyrimidine photolyase-related protein
MDMFIDAYDWVMVPNIYGMSQPPTAVGSQPKPYFSSSSYILRMSDYKKGDWCRIWDNLYWRFLYNQRERLSKNSRMRLAVRNLDRMEEKKLKDHLAVVGEFLQSLEF